jgi:hypothetical protein
MTPEPLSILLPRVRDELMRAIKDLETWGVKVPGNSRLRVAAERLDATALMARASISAEERDELCAAVLTGLNFRDIAASLPPQRVRALRMDLEIAVTGTLFGPATARKPMQFESQHLVAAALRLAGLEPRYPKAGKGAKSPDVLIAKSGLEYGVEVKRPESSNAVMARLDDARDQLDATGTVGGIAIDATDVLKGLRHQELLTAVQTLQRQIDDVVCPAPRLGYRAGYERIVCVLVLARGVWVRADVTPALLSVEHSAACSVYGFEDTIVIGEWMQAAFARGFERTGFSR